MCLSVARGVSFFLGRRSQRGPTLGTYNPIAPKNDKRENMTKEKKEIWPTNGLHSQGHNFALQNVSFCIFFSFFSSSMVRLLQDDRSLKRVELGHGRLFPAEFNTKNA